MQRLFRLTLGVVLAAGTAYQATAQTKPAPKPAATPAATELVELDLSPQQIPLTLRVPKGTVAATDEYGVVTVIGPNVNIYFDRSLVPRAEAIDILKTRLAGMVSMGFVGTQTNNPLMVYAKSTSPNDKDWFMVAIENPATRTHYIVQAMEVDKNKKPLGQAYAKGSYAAAKSARFNAPGRATKAAGAPVAASGTAGRTSATGKPLYAGLYINGNQVSEVDCYGIDRVDLVYPFFSTLSGSIDRLDLRLSGGHYDQAGKFVVEYTRGYGSYEGVELSAIREKYAERGYGVASAPGQVEEYNNLRGNYPKENLIVGTDIGEGAIAFPALKYTNTDPAATKGSVVYFEVFGSVITGYKSSRYSDGTVYNTYPTFQSTVLYTSPKIPLRNRVLASTVAYKTGTPEPGTTTASTEAPKTGRFGRAALGALNKFTGSSAPGQRAPYQLPSATDEHCATKGTPLTLEQIQAVPAGGYGEQVLQH